MTKVFTLGEAAKEAIDFYGIDDPDKKLQLVPSGIHAVDRAVGGYSPSQLVTILADTGVGKSSIILECCRVISKKGVVPGYISLEDPIDFVGLRALSAESGVNGLRVRRGDVTEAQREMMQHSAARLTENPTLCAFSSGGSVEEVCDMMHALGKKGAGIFFVDYLQKMRSKDLGERSSEIGWAMTKLQRVAGIYKAPIVLVSQISLQNSLNAKKNDGWPLMQAKESGDVVNESRTVVLLKKDETSGGVAGKLAKSSVGGEGVKFDFHRMSGGGLREVE